MASDDIPSTSPEEAHRLQGQGDVLIDVREPHETADGHAAGARLIPLDQLQERHDELPRDQRLLLLCASGNRAAVATEQLRSAGFDAINVEGGTTAWQDRDLPMAD